MGIFTDDADMSYTPPEKWSRERLVERVKYLDNENHALMTVAYSADSMKAAPTVGENKRLKKALLKAEARIEELLALTLQHSSEPPRKWEPPELSE